MWGRTRNEATWGKRMGGGDQRTALTLKPSLRTAFSVPQLACFGCAIALAGYWFGLAVVAMCCAIIGPALALFLRQMR